MPIGPYPSRTRGWGPKVLTSAWFIKFPLDAYALGPVRFETLVTESEVRQWARAFAGVSRLPQGFQCWPA